MRIPIAEFMPAETVAKIITAKSASAARECAGWSCSTAESNSDRKDSDDLTQHDKPPLKQRLL
jgi:hypothetical protein